MRIYLLRTVLKKNPLLLADHCDFRCTGTTEDIDKLARRQVKPTRQHNEECRRLLGLMGIPFLIVSSGH